MAKTKQEIKAKVPKATATSSPSPFAKFIPHVTAILAFIMVTLLFFSPMLLDDKTLPQGDISQWEGMSKELRDNRDRTHAEPLWTNSMFGGMPAFQISTLYPGNLIQYLDKLAILNLPEFTGFLFAACLGFYLLLLTLSVSPWLAIAGSLAYSLASYNLIIIEAGHNTKMHAIALIPYVVAGFMLLWQRRYLFGAAVSALAFAMLIEANHVQIAYYLFLTLVIAGAVFLVYSVRDKDMKHYVLAFGIFAGTGVLGVMANMSLLWTTYEYGNSTIRGKSDLTSNTQSKGGLDRDYAFGWSYGKAELMTLLIPNFYGGSSHQMLDEDSKSIQALRSRGVQPQAMPTYWGAQPFTSGPVYLGALMCFLFILGLVIVDGPLKWWLGLATLFSLLISLGHNLAWFNNLIFDLLPGYNKFRTVTMSLIICQLTVPLLGILTISRLIKGEFFKERATTGLYIAGGITAGLALVFGLFGSAFFNFSGAEDKSLPDWLIGAIKDDRASLMRSDALRSLALILAGVGVVWAIINERISQNLAIGAVLVICLFDYVGVGKRFVNGESFSAKGQEAAKFPLSPADQQILQDKTLDYRVFNTTVNSFNDASTSYHHRSVGGYHAAKLRRYQELIENHISKGNLAVLNMLNTKYIIQKGQDGQPAAGQNPNACGNAWFVGQVQQVANADEEIKALEKFDPLVTAFVDKKFAANLSGIAEGKDSSATITLTSYEPNHLVYQTSNAKDQLAVISEIYYQPGWVATIDGKDAPIIRANYVLRAMNLPAGSHKIEMQFLPSSYFTGEKVSLASSLLILALLAFAIFKEVKGERALA